MAAIAHEVGQVDLYALWPESRLWCHRFEGGREDASLGELSGLLLDRGSQSRTGAQKTRSGHVSG